MSRDFSQWPLPSHELDTPVVSDIYIEPTKNQLNELKKKLQPIQQIILSFRPRQKPIGYYIPDFDEEEDVQINDSDEQEIKSIAEVDDTNSAQLLSDKLYQIFDQSIIHTLSSFLLVKFRLFFLF